MSARWQFLVFIIPLAILSTWLFDAVEETAGKTDRSGKQGPDSYMENFRSLNMDTGGRPANRLDARYMAHYPDHDLTELSGPRLAVYRTGKQPTYITARSGQVTGDNEVILLQDDVRLWQEDAGGNTDMEVLTSEARIYTDKEVAETDRPATLIRHVTRTKTVGLRAHFSENRLELLNNVHTTIYPESAD